MGNHHPTMTEPNCCEKPPWRYERDLGSAGGFDFALGKCARCGTVWMNVFCVAAGTSGYERVTVADADAIRAIREAGPLKAFMRRWGDQYL